MLLTTEIDIDHVNRIGYTALHEAVVLGDGGASHERTVAALVRGGVDTSIEDSAGRTALQSARDPGYTRIADLLGLTRGPAAHLGPGLRHRDPRPAAQQLRQQTARW